MKVPSSGFVSGGLMKNLAILKRAAILGSTFLAGYALAQRGPPKEPKGVKMEDLGAMDLAGEIDSLEGLRLRLNRLTVQPGGMSPLHSHKGHPQIVYMVQGSYVSHAEGKKDEVLHASDVVPGCKERVHWIENVGTEPAVAMVCTLVK